MVDWVPNLVVVLSTLDETPIALGPRVKIGRTVLEDTGGNDAIVVDIDDKRVVVEEDGELTGSQMVGFFSKQLTSWNFTPS